MFGVFCVPVFVFHVLFCGVEGGSEVEYLVCFVYCPVFGAFVMFDVGEVVSVFEGLFYLWVDLVFAVDGVAVGAVWVLGDWFRHV